MNRQQFEREYWNKNALDPEVDKKYISDLDTGECLEAIGKLEGEVLEIGCGVGRLMKRGYHGIDISENMIDIARERKSECIFQVNNGQDIPYPDDYFNSVYSVLVFQHIPIANVYYYISEASRVLKDKGKFVFQFIEGDEDEPFSKHYNLSDIVEIMDYNDFVVKSVKKSLVHHMWTWVYAKKTELGISN